MDTQERLDGLSDREAAAWYDRRGHDPDPVDEVEVDVDVAPTLDVTMSFRLPADEAEVIRVHAREAGVTMSRWIRDACAAHAGDGPRYGEPAVVDAHLIELGLLARRFADGVDQLRERVTESSAPQDRLLEAFIDPVAHLRAHLPGLLVPDLVGHLAPPVATRGATEHRTG